MKRLAIIPARGGSKRIPHKNIKPFCGKPMIAHVLDAAANSNLFETIHVSTDSENIAGVVKGLGHEIDFMRPKKLSDDFTPIMPVLKYVLEEYEKTGQSFDQVWLLMACSPLLEPKDLKEAEDIFNCSDKQRALLAVSEYPVPVEWAFSMNKERELTPLQPGMFSKRSQDIETKYFDAGTFAIFPSSIIFEAEGAGSDKSFIGYPLPKGTAIDIDTEDDWLLAEAIYHLKNGKKTDE